MYEYVSVQLVSLVYIIILSVVYFLKRKYNFLESKMYKTLLMITISTLVLDISNIMVLKLDIFGIPELVQGGGYICILKK